jgi:pilus assembly protein Flp/PilA
MNAGFPRNTGGHAAEIDTIARGLFIDITSKKMCAFVKENRGVTMLEYGVLAALICVVCITIIGTVGTDINPALANVEAAKSLWCGGIPLCRNLLRLKCD